jgi:FAD/FMN-containing dehydrogenase
LHNAARRSLGGAQHEAVRDHPGPASAPSRSARWTAEHGIGRLKPYMMPDWHGGAELEAMRRIRAALDPLGIMNPGKLLP